MKNLKNTGITLSIALAASTILLAQTTSSIGQPDLNQISYYQKSTIAGPDGVDLYSLPAPMRYQEWFKTFAVGFYPDSNSPHIRLNVDKKLGETVTVYLLDEKGRVLDKNWLDARTSKFRYSFNFSQIGDGIYTIEVTSGQEVFRRTLHLSTPGRTAMTVK